MKTSKIVTWSALIMLTNSFVVSAQESKWIDFQQHIQPILEAKCISCHGPESSKGGLRVDDLDSLRGYIEAGNVEGSSLWTDYLRSSDPEMLMPPASPTQAAGLPNSDLLFIKTWIAEGAEGSWKAVESTDESKTKDPEPQSTAAKWWAFQGVFHPAAVHLPIALLSISTFFVFLSFFNSKSFDPAAFHCLWIGALGAILACLSGWSYAVHEGYGNGFGFDLQKSPIDRHRWLGVAVAAWALLMIPLAINVCKTGFFGRRITWLLAGAVLVLGVSVTGHQGGELIYGEGHYTEYYQQLFGKPTKTEQKLENNKPVEEDQKTTSQGENDTNIVEPSQSQAAEKLPTETNVPKESEGTN